MIRLLLLGKEAHYLCATPREFWLPGQESNLRLAVSKAALRTITECLAVVGAGGVEPLVLDRHSCFGTTVLQTAEWTSALEDLVDPAGFAPAASCLQGRRSPD